MLRRFGRWPVLLLALLVVVAGLSMLISVRSGVRAGGDPGVPPPDAPVVRFPAANTFAIVELAVTDEQRQRGLMGRERLEDGTGMLFVFPVRTGSPFWMKDTPLPLSIAFIGEDRVIVDIQDMQPFDETLHYPAAPYRYALEAPQGWFGRAGIAVGQRVELPDGV